MLIAAVVCMLIAVIALGVGICFVKENKTLLALLSTFALIALICLGICVAAYANDFSGISILLIISICPLFVNVCLPFKNEENKKPVEEEQISDTQNLSENNDQTENWTKKDEKTIKSSVKSENNAKFGAFLVNFGEIVRGAAYLLSTLAIAFCGLYIGKESAFAFLFGIAIGLVLTFLDTLIKKDDKEKSIKKLLLSYAEKFLIFTSVGLLFGAILLALLYSLSLTHILFAGGCLIYATFLLLQRYLKTPYNHLAYLLAMILLLATILI